MVSFQSRVASMIRVIDVPSYGEWRKYSGIKVKEKTLYRFDTALILFEPDKVYSTFRVRLTDDNLVLEFYQDDSGPGYITKEEFIELIKKYHPDCMEWFLFNKEWLE